MNIFFLIGNIFIITLFICPNARLDAEPYPIGFAIPESKIVKNIPEKDKDFAHIIPGHLHTYIFDNEADYFKDYQRSYFAITCKKAGWDCMRHYEILASGCIPYFLDLDLCNEKTMYFLPKDLIKEAMNLEGVSYLNIDHSKFDRAKYDEILNKLLVHTRKHLTTKQMASYVLKTINYSGEGKILYLSHDVYPDYLRCLMLTGFKELLPGRVVDVPKIDHIYKSYPHDIRALYGKGISYTKNIDDLPIDRENVEERIKNKEFDLVIYGSVHRGLRYIDLVQRTYEPEKIVYLCGEDAHLCGYANLHNLFLREFTGY